MFASPAPALVTSGSKPAPSSWTRSRSTAFSGPARSSQTSTRWAPACLAAFCRASRQQKYSAASTCRDWRGTSSASIRTSTGLVTAAARRAGTSPSSSSSRGYMPLDRATRVSIVSSAARAWARSWAVARTGALVARVWASRRLTASATRCCCAPSWMSRSSRRRSSSWVWTSRSREARSSAARSASSASRWASSARSRALRSASPAWAARPANSRSSTGVSADRSPSWRRSTPSSSPPWRTGRARRPGAVASRAPSRGSGGKPAPAAPVADGGQVAAGTSRSPTASHTWAHRALVPSASTRAIRSGSWSAGYSAATVAENRLRTSYGDGPCPRRRCTVASRRCCTGSNPSATITVARTDKVRSGESVRPTRAPPPRTTTR